MARHSVRLLLDHCSYIPPTSLLPHCSISNKQGMHSLRLPQGAIEFPPYCWNEFLDCGIRLLMLKSNWCVDLFLGNGRYHTLSRPWMLYTKYKLYEPAQLVYGQCRSSNVSQAQTETCLYHLDSYSKDQLFWKFILIFPVPQAVLFRWQLYVKRKCAETPFLLQIT